MMTNTDDTDGAHNVDITNPAEWFPEARKIRRHIIMHIGPTNSGKTYRALQKLKSVEPWVLRRAVKTASKGSVR